VARIDASLKVLVAQMYGMSLAYDEGIVGDDATLYAALWRCGPAAARAGGPWWVRAGSCAAASGRALAAGRNMTDMQGAPHAVALLTQYVRREVARLDALPVEVRRRACLHHGCRGRGRAQGDWIPAGGGGGGGGAMRRVQDLYLGRFQWHPPAESLEV